MIDEIVALPGRERLARFEGASERLQAVLNSIRPEDLYRPVWDPKGVILVRHLPGRYLFDLVLHEWDIRNMPDAPLSSDALGIMLKGLVYHLSSNYEKSNKTDISGSFRFQVTDPAYAWGLFFDGRRASPIPADTGKFDATITATASDMLLFATGRTDFQTKQAAGRLRIDGNRTKGETILRRIFLPY